MENKKLTINKELIKKAQERRANIKELGLEPMTKYVNKLKLFWRKYQSFHYCIEDDVTLTYLSLLEIWYQHNCNDFEINLSDYRPFTLKYINTLHKACLIKYWNFIEEDRRRIKISI